MLRLVTVGHVDHGKSTLVARLLEATGQVSLDGLREPAFALDALEEERAQGVSGVLTSSFGLAPAVTVREREVQ